MVTLRTQLPRPTWQNPWSPHKRTILLIPGTEPVPSGIGSVVFCITYTMTGTNGGGPPSPRCPEDQDLPRSAFIHGSTDARVNRCGLGPGGSSPQILLSCPHSPSREIRLHALHVLHGGNNKYCQNSPPNNAAYHHLSAERRSTRSARREWSSALRARPLSRHHRRCGQARNPPLRQHRQPA